MTTQDTETERDAGRQTSESVAFARPSRMYDDLRRRHERRALVARIARAMRTERRSRSTVPRDWWRRDSR